MAAASASAPPSEVQRLAAVLMGRWLQPPEAAAAPPPLESPLDGRRVLRHISLGLWLKQEEGVALLCRCGVRVDRSVAAAT